jgi:catechol 2,3-dioxygenase
MPTADELAHIFDSVVGTVELRVSDAGRQRDFYERGIGLHTNREDGTIELSGAGEHPLVRLDSSQTTGAGQAPGPHTGLFHIAFRYPDRASLGAAVARTAKATSDLQGASDHGVSEAVYFGDPEGNGIELYRDRPFDDWPLGEPGKVGMFTQPLDLRALLDEAAPEGEEQPPDIGHIHLMTSEVERTVGFWRGAVGLNERQRFGPQAAFLAEGQYHHHIGANTWHSAGAGPAPPGTVGLESFELRLRDADAVETAASGVESSGVSVERVTGGARFRDPDGIFVIIAARGV